MFLVRVLLVVAVGLRVGGLEHFIHESVRLGLVGGEILVAFTVLRDLLEGLADHISSSCDLLEKVIVDVADGRTIDWCDRTEKGHYLYRVNGEQDPARRQELEGYRRIQPADIESGSELPF